MILASSIDASSVAMKTNQNRVEIEEPGQKGGVTSVSRVLVGGSDENQLEQGAIRSSGLYFIQFC